MSKENFLKEVARQKGTNTNLKAQKVALSLVEDIQEKLDRADYTDMIEELIDEASSKMIQARDIFRFEMTQDMGGAEEEIGILENQLRDLGVDDTSVTDNLRQQLNSLEEKAQDIRRRFQDMGWDAIS